MIVDVKQNLSKCLLLAQITYCIFHMTPQFHLHSWSIFEVLVLAQFLMNCLKSLCMVLYIFNVDAYTSTSSNFCFLNFWFFMPSSQGWGIKMGKSGR